MSYLGRDFSSYQGDLTPADCAGISFAYVKVTDGYDYQNPYAPQQVAALRAAGVEVGFYHFFEPADQVEDQAHNFAKMAQALGGSKLPLAIDFELTDGQNWQTLAVELVDFAMTIESWQTPVPNPRTILYVNLSFYESLAGFPWGRWVWLADPNAGAPHKPCLVLQGAPRPVSGADPKSVDPDTFEGSQADWEAFIGATAPAVPAPEPTNAVPGPNGIEVTVIGQMAANGLYQGHPALNGITVYAGVGNPTTWVTGFDAKTLPAGTPLAVALTDKANVGTNVVSEQL